MFFNVRSNRQLEPAVPLNFSYRIQAGLRRGGLTPACGFAHARYDRGCHWQTEAVSATSQPREVR